MWLKFEDEISRSIFSVVRWPNAYPLELVTSVSQEGHEMASWNLMGNLISVTVNYGQNLRSKYWDSVFGYFYWLFIGISRFPTQAAGNFFLCAVDLQIIVGVYPENFMSLNDPREKLIILLWNNCWFSHVKEHFLVFISTSSAHPTDSLALLWKNCAEFWNKKNSSRSRRIVWSPTSLVARTTSSSYVRVEKKHLS